MVAVALVKYRLFGIDFRLKQGIHAGTIAAIFAAGFFVGFELLERFIPVNDAALGIASAAAIALAFKPVKSMARGVADSAFPGVKSYGDMTRAERLAAYSEQVRLMWADRRLTDQERLLLDNLRKRLKIRPGEAAEIEAVFEAAKP